MASANTSRDPDPRAERPQRLVSLDAYRGFIMITLAGSGFGLAATAKRLGYGPDVSVDSAVGRLWQFLAFHTGHPQWNSQFGVIGCSYWDLIQPAFMFMVGVAMPFSYARRIAEGQSTTTMWIHAFKRAVILVLLGVFLQSRSGAQTNWLFTNVLSQIGLGYLFVLLLLGRNFLTQAVVGAVVLIGYWFAFVAYTPPAAILERLGDVEVSSDISGMCAAHFVKNANFASAFDRWFLNLFPRGETFEAWGGGYATLNFVPSLVTMLLGAMAGQLLRGPREPLQKLRLLLLGGVACMAVGLLAGFTVCPIVKRVWTPSWTLSSGAWVLWMLAAFYWVIDICGYKRWAFPLVVVGTNSIAIYLMGQSLKPWTAKMLKIHFGQTIFDGPYGPMVQAISVAAVFWLACWWMYRQKIFIRI